MLYLNPRDNVLIRSNKPQISVNSDGSQIEWLLVHEAPEPNDEYTLIDIDIKNEDGTYGKWILDLDKVKNKYIEFTRVLWEESFYKPLDTPYGFRVQQSKIDLDLWRDGILNRIIELAVSGDIELTQDEYDNLMIGTMLGSVYNKAKTFLMTIRDYDNNTHDISIETARNIAMLQAQSIASNFSKKWNIQNIIKNAETYESIISAYENYDQ